MEEKIMYASVLLTMKAHRITFRQQKTSLKIQFFSADSGNLEGGDEGGNWRQLEKTYGEGRGELTTGIKKAHEKECSECVEGCQKKRDLLFTRKELSKPDLPADGSALFVNQKVTDACALIQNPWLT